MSRIQVLPGLDAGSYAPHPLHGPDAIWLEKNCYSDLWIELLHTLKLDPMPLFPFTLAVDFLGDQWTFFKPSLEEMRDLYGIDVQELTVWRPLIAHAVEHLGAGSLVSTEADSFWLPDTSGTDYRTKHGKTTIVLADLDVDARHLGYFHNAGYFELSGEDFTELFRLDKKEDATFLPLFAEVVYIDRLRRRSPADLSTRSLGFLRRHLERRPPTNPFSRFSQRLTQDFPALQQGGLEHYHAWAFASIRQAGAAFELAALNLRWLAGFDRPFLLDVASCFETIAQGNKALILKGARAVNSGRPIDASALLSDMGQSWERGMDLLDATFMKPETT